MKRIKKENKKKKQSSYAVTSVVETLLLLSMTVGFFSVLYLSVFSFSFTPLPPSVHILGTTSGDDIILYHQGGDSLSIDSTILLTIDDVQSKLTLGDYLDTQAKSNDRWNMGEQLVIDDFTITNHQASIIIVDKETNVVIYHSNL